MAPLSNKTLFSLTAVFLFSLLFIVYVGLRINKKQESVRLQPSLRYTPHSTSYEIVIIADPDTATSKDFVQAVASKYHSENPNKPKSITFETVLMIGTLTRNTGQINGNVTYSVEWKKRHFLRHGLNEGGRGMELSDLCWFNGELLAFDDRTGVAFSIFLDRFNSDGTPLVVPRYVFTVGDGFSQKGMKIEWSTVKDGTLFVGSIGKEWTTQQGEYIDDSPFWIKTIDSERNMKSVNWTNVYTSMRKSTDTLPPGYLIHESCQWHPKDRRWYFLPRRVSKARYDDVKDEERGGNLLISLNEHFDDVKVKKVGKHHPLHGFSAFKFLPFRDDEIVALKTFEYREKIGTYITVFTKDGRVLMDETFIDNIKFEGIEII